MVAIGADDIDCWARQQATLRSRMTRTNGFVVGVEQIGESRVEDPVAWIERGQDERFEKPGRVRQMPFRRADIRHRLDSLVLGRQIDRKRLAGSPYGSEPVEHSLAIRAAGLYWRGIIEHEVPQSISSSQLTFRKAGSFRRSR